MPCKDDDGKSFRKIQRWLGLQVLTRCRDLCLLSVKSKFECRFQVSTYHVKLVRQASTLGAVHMQLQLHPLMGLVDFDVR